MPTTPTLTLDQVLDTLLAVAAENPDYIWAEDEKHGHDDRSSCTYTEPNGSPSCIVGHVFYRLAPEALTVLHENEWGVDEDDEPMFLESDTILTLQSQWKPFDTLIDQPTAQVLRAAQSRQDTKYTWAAAAAAAARAAQTLKDGGELAHATIEVPL